MNSETLGELFLVHLFFFGTFASSFPKSLWPVLIQNW